MHLFSRNTVTLFYTHSLKIKSKKEGKKHDYKRNYEENQYCQWPTFYVWASLRIFLNLFDLILNWAFQFNERLKSEISSFSM